MKMFRSFTLALCATFMLCACGGESPQTPESVAESFYKAQLDIDFAEIAKYATKETTSWLEATFAETPDSEIDEWREKSKGTKISVISSEVKEDKATVTLELTLADGDKHKENIRLVKEDGSWKVEDYF
jgi:uncharacterized protein YchJ